MAGGAFSGEWLPLFRRLGFAVDAHPASRELGANLSLDGSAPIPLIPAVARSLDFAAASTEGAKRG
jgi:hypothetical protein